MVDKFDRFLEYNTTTTQSDYGDKFYVLLDFLRVESVYDRDAWERIPDSIVHRTLAMAGKQNALSLLEDALKKIREKKQTDMCRVCRSLNRIMAFTCQALQIGSTNDLSTARRQSNAGSD